MAGGVERDDPNRRPAAANRRIIANRAAGQRPNVATGSTRARARPLPHTRLRGDPVTGKRQKRSKKKGAPGGGKDNERVIAQNRKARHNYVVLDTLECGLVLVGSEVKSLRAGRVSLEEAYGRVRGGEVWLVGCDIQEYVEANRFNHDPRRPRKLLLHRREVRRFAAQASERGLTLVPLKMYFKRGRAKVLMGVCRGRQKYDKRQAMKKAEAKREMQRALRRR